MAIGRAASDILIRIRGDNKDFNSKLKQSNRDLKNFRKNITDSYGELMLWGGGVVGALGMAAVSSIKAAMATEQLERGFKNLAASQGKSADQYIQKLKQVSHGTVSEAEIMRKANQAMLLGLDLDDITKMMETSSVIAQATGQNVGYMFESMALGTARSSKQLLDNLGIMIELDTAYKEYAVTHEILNRELTETEKKLAVTDAAMVSAGEKMGDLGGFVDDTASKWQRFNAQIEDSKALLGEEFLPAASEGLTKINNALVLSADGHSKILELTAKQNKTIQEQILLNILLSDATNKEKVAALDAYNLFKDSIKILEVSTDETSRMTDAEWKKAEAIYTALGYSKEYLDTLRAQTEETKNQTSEIEKQMSIMDRYYQSQKQPSVVRGRVGSKTRMSAAMAKEMGFGSSHVDSRISSSRSGL